MRTAAYLLMGALGAVVLGCDAGITAPTGTRVVAFTPQYPSGTGCAQFADGHLLCQGGNIFGQLGIGTVAEHAYGTTNDTPVDASTHFTSVAVGGDHACALDGAGAAWCWGRNSSGELGVGDTLGPENCSYTEYVYPIGEVAREAGCATRPVKVLTSVHFRQLVLDYDRSCGVSTSGALYCWGNAAYDRFGAGVSGGEACVDSHCDTPTRAAPGQTFLKISMNNAGTCGIAGDRAIYCWGIGYNPPDRFGRPPDDATPSSVPTPVNSDAQFADLSLSEDHTCAISTAGAVICFGFGGSGQLGDGTNSTRYTAIPLDLPQRFTKIAVSSGRSCALSSDGKAWCWGYNADGGLGVGNFLPAPTPQPVLGELAFFGLQLGDLRCGTARDGLWCWGQLPSRFEQ